jgi:hypothetical protein
MKTILLSSIIFLSAIQLFAQLDNSIEPVSHKKYVSELGLSFPLKSQHMKDYINLNNVQVAPLTSGFGAGFQLGGHRILNENATLGVLLNSNMFLASGEHFTQVYQMGAYLTGRLYFGDTWRNGVFTEIGAGPEFAAASIQGGDFQFQGNFASRIGLGYNYQFNKDVTLGASVVVSPSLTSDDYLNETRVVINMLW